MGETRVDLVHLLEDLRDAYPGALEETILTELVANALDSGATVIRVTADPAHATLTVVDDGRGMQRRELRRFHDIAASAKVRGEGIGFAGVGVKLGLLLCEHVLTETRRGKTHVATRWHLASRYRAPWKWVPPATGLVNERGTAVVLALKNPLSPLVDAGYVEGALRRHYQPLFEPDFRDVLAPWYPHGVAFEVNGRPLLAAARHDVGVTPPSGRHVETAPLAVRIGRKRKPAAVGYLMRTREVLDESERGLAVSTLGKVIKRGWDWLGLTPAAADAVGGLIEVPALAACLTLNKADFVRVGVRGATYLGHRKAVQEAVAEQLAIWGDAHDAATESRRRVARPLERDLERVLLDLADAFPLVATLVEQRTNGQRRLPLAGARGGNGRMVLAGVEDARRTGAAGEMGGAGVGVDVTGMEEVAGGAVGEAAAGAGGGQAAPFGGIADEVETFPAATPEGFGTAADANTAAPPAGGGAASPEEGNAAALPPGDEGTAPGTPNDETGAAGHATADPDRAATAGVAGSRAAGRSRRAPRLGLGIQFEERPDDAELGHLVESTVWVNTAHPAYRRASASRSEGYHVALTTALALAPLAVEPAAEHAFVTAFLASWGELGDRAGGRRRRGR
jgi:Histidine kinase-, DNA gyrase B-, and HSP90-like ATPase